MSSDQPLSKDAESRNPTTLSPENAPTTSDTGEEAAAPRQEEPANSTTDGQGPAESSPPRQNAPAEAESPPQPHEESTPSGRTPTEAGQRPASAERQSSDSKAQELRRRLRSTPKIDESKAKAVPSLDPVSQPAAGPLQPTTETPPPEQTADPAAESASPEPPPQPSTPPATAETAQAAPSSVPSEEQQQPEQPEAAESSESVAEDAGVSGTPPTEQPREVDLPPGDQELDSDLEAAIEAAMSGEQQQTADAGPDSEGQTGAAAQPGEEELERGARLNGRIQAIRGDDVFLDVGYRSPAVVSSRQFAAGKGPEVGQLIEVRFDRHDPGEGLMYVNLPKGMRKVGGNWDAVEEGQLVECTVQGTNKGGLEVNVGGLRGFMPASHVELFYVPDLQPYVGQKFRAQIIEVNPKKRKLVVSRREYLEIERRQAEEELWQTLDVGQHLGGTVKTIKDYGAFIDIGGVDGFLHIGEISWGHIHHPSEVLKEGQQVEVKVLKLDKEKKKIGLGMRQLMPNPWADVAEKYPAGKTVSGQVTRTTKFGAFIELEPGVEGLVHISELDHRRVKQVSDVLKEGQQTDVQVLDVDPERKRIGLSLKALKEKPEEAAPDETAREQTARPRRRNRPLKGGIGGGKSGGGLFGDPRDFS